MQISIAFTVDTQLFFYIRTFFISYLIDLVQCYAPDAHPGIFRGLGEGVFSFDLLFSFFTDWSWGEHVQSLYATLSLMTIMNRVKGSNVYFW